MVLNEYDIRGFLESGGNRRYTRGQANNTPSVSYGNVVQGNPFQTVHSTRRNESPPIATEERQGILENDLGERMPHLRELYRNDTGNRPLHMGAHAHVQAPIRFQITDTRTPPYGYSHHDAREGEGSYFPAILTHPSFSPVYGQMDNPMDPPIAPEIVSDAIGIPLIHRVEADGNQVVRDTADIFHQNLPARQNYWDALPAYHARQC